MFCSNRWPVWAASFAVIVTLASCGGKASNAPTLSSGRFLDGPVQGLSYETATVKNGLTDADGRFSYRVGETVTFSIGGLVLPPVPGADVITPLDLVDTRQLNDPKVVNLLVLLQSLDEDGVPSNGIKIPSKAAKAAEGAAGQALREVLINASVADFAGSQQMRDFLDASLDVQRGVVATQVAVDHFAQTLADEKSDLRYVSRLSIVKDDAQGPDVAVDRPFRVRFEGRNLGADLIAQASGACTTMVAAGDPTATAVEFTCTPSTTGALQVALKDGDRTLYSHAATVPEPQVEMVTSLGAMTLELNVAKAPVSSRNFLRYVDAGYYDNTVFHRIIGNFMVQGGGYVVNNNSLQLKGGTFDPIALERTTVTGLSHLAGTLAMARTDVEDSATSQFFINTVDNAGLDATSTSAGYAVFGRVVAGDATLQALRSVPVAQNGRGELSLPLSPPVIHSVIRSR